MGKGVLGDLYVGSGYVVLFILLFIPAPGVVWLHTKFEKVASFYCFELSICA
uniref:Uncharacterized protein n=1 Tax=Anguilla anguilla TaxID=7936 RepID=A0A0E9UI31_ANGAN